MIRSRGSGVEGGGSDGLVPLEKWLYKNMASALRLRIMMWRITACGG